MKTLTSVVAIMLGVYGCTPYDSRLGYRLSDTPEPPLRFAETQAVKLHHIVNQNVDDLKKTFDDAYQEHFQNAKFDVSALKLTNGYEFTFSWSSPQAYFAPGEYDVMRNVPGDDRGGIAFLDLVASGVTKIANDLDQLGVRYRLNAIFEGRADGLRVKDTGLSYRNEYGDVLLPSDVTTLNGVPHTFRIKAHQYISNEELAALRAYSMKDFVARAAGRREISSRYEITITEAVGRNHRFARVHLSLVEG